MQVEIWTDVVCPWCYVGKARFDKALAAFERRQDVAVRYRSFELDPDAPVTDPPPVLDMLAAKYGVSVAQAGQMERRVAEAAQGEGLPYGDRRHGNTFLAHQVLQHAAVEERQPQVLDALMKAHFGGARSLFDRDSLVDIGEDAGLDRDQARKSLDTEAFADDVRADESLARALGISSVPMFVLDRRIGVPGAQPVEVLLSALRQA